MRTRILLALAALIAYGSLYPFRFAVPDAQAAAWAKLLGDRSLLGSRADMLGNFALFVPFGFAAVAGLARDTRFASRVAVTALAAFALALLLQLAQIYVPERTAALGDVFWNLLGTVAGGVAGALAVDRLRLLSHRLRTAATLPLGLLAMWLAAELLPFVPSLDPASIKDNLKGLLRPSFAPAEFLFHAAGALIAGRALAAIVGEARSLRWLWLLSAALAAARPFVVTRALDVATLSGLALGCALWWLLAQRREPQRALALVLFASAAYAFGALMPFEIRDTPEAFNFVPFAGTLRGSMLANSQALAASLYLYAGILGVMRLSRASVVASSIALALLVLLFEVIQMFLVGRTPDITEPLLVVLAGQALRFAPDAAPAHRVPAEPERIPQRPVSAPSGKASLARWGIALAIVCTAMAAVMAAVLRAPGIPYNVAELFLGDGSFGFLVVFALAILWTGAGARLAGHRLATSDRPWLALPPLAFGAAMVSLLLMSASVTQESIGDISGSNNLHWFVINKSIWGEWARQLFMLIPAEVVAFVERPVRYAALYGPLVTFLALMFAGLEVRSGNGIAARRMLPLLASALLWLWLCKGIAFDWSSTDNLNELIARDGPRGWGGGGYLYALLAVVCANAVLLARMPATPGWSIVGVAVTLAALPVGWWLLNLGLEPEVHKYGNVFSGAQFLLGPDRKNILDPQVLFLRWSAVQFAGVLVLALGARFAQTLIAHARLPAA